ncbi:MAG: toll/interleukin-1 receptor domain-containing protein [Acidobacteria bacterium]|nr:toll/interleukin-1 receptor domain-containing protein [Acidobacteriota bacterium]
MRLKAFISYSTADKHIAAQVKTDLNEHGIAAFLAHNDINVSQEWKDRIVQELNETNVFVPLLSVSFKESDWAPQEIGMAVTQNDLLFIPLSVDGTVPFGFISHIQGKRIPANGIYRDLLLEPIIIRFTHEIIPTLIEQLAGASSFLNAEALMLPLAHHFDKFNDEEIDKFATASIENNQIWDEHHCRHEHLPAFLKLHRSRMVPEKLEALEYQIKHRQWYHLRTNT